MANSKTSIIKVNNDIGLHVILTALSNEGVHGIRIKDGKVQYYSKSEEKWLDTLPDDIKISPNAYNALKKLPNGYYVRDFPVSADPNNAIIKKADGYYVYQEKNVAHTSDITNINNRIDDEVYNITNEIGIISDKLLQIQGGNTKVKEFTYDNDTDEFVVVADTSSLIDITRYAILNVRLLIENKSTKQAEFQTTEKDIETMFVTLGNKEVQQYDLGNANRLKVFAKGNIRLYIRITYI